MPILSVLDYGNAYLVSLCHHRSTHVLVTNPFTPLIIQYLTLSYVVYLGGVTSVIGGSVVGGGSDLITWGGGSKGSVLSVTREGCNEVMRRDKRTNIFYKLSFLANDKFSLTCFMLIAPTHSCPL